MPHGRHVLGIPVEGWGEYRQVFDSQIEHLLIHLSVFVLQLREEPVWASRMRNDRVSPRVYEARRI